MVFCPDVVPDKVTVQAVSATFLLVEQNVWCWKNTIHFVKRSTEKGHKDVDSGSVVAVSYLPPSSSHTCGQRCVSSTPSGWLEHSRCTSSPSSPPIKRATEKNGLNQVNLDFWLVNIFNGFSKFPTCFTKFPLRIPEDSTTYTQVINQSLQVSCPSGRNRNSIFLDRNLFLPTIGPPLISPYCSQPPWRHLLAVNLQGVSG